MAYLHIGCDSCGGAWEVYMRDSSGRHARRCPHCGKGIPEFIWNDGILPALVATQEAEMQLAENTAKYHAPQFEINICGNALFRNRGA